MSWLIDMKGRDFIHSEGSALWGLKTRQMDEYIRKANKALAGCFKEDAEIMKNILIKRFVKIHDMALVDGHPIMGKTGEQIASNPDYAAANKALENIGELYGLYKLKTEIEDKRDPELAKVPTEILLEYAKSAVRDSTPPDEF